MALKIILCIYLISVLIPIIWLIYSCTTVIKRLTKTYNLNKLDCKKPSVFQCIKEIDFNSHLNAIVCVFFPLINTVVSIAFLMNWNKHTQELYDGFATEIEDYLKEKSNKGE